MKTFKFFRGYVIDDVFEDFFLPTARRMAGRMIANELVQIQPMNEPRGRLFYMNFTRTAGPR
jgi:hypothetical protein